MDKLKAKAETTVNEYIHREKALQNKIQMVTKKAEALKKTRLLLQLAESGKDANDSDDD